MIVATTAPERAATAAANAMRRHIGTTAGGMGCEPVVSNAPSRARRTSWTSAIRCFGFLCRHRRRYRAERGREVGRKPCPVWIPREHRGQRLRHVVAVEGAPCGEALVEHAAERPDVGALVDRPPARLLGAHVGNGPEDHARRRGWAVIVGDCSTSAAVRSLRRRPSPSPARSPGPSPCRPA